MSGRIVERVRKLLSLSRSPCAHEAAAAAAKAEELIRKYGVDRAALEPDGLAMGTERESFVYDRATCLWKRDLAYAVARLHSCLAVHTPASRQSGGRPYLHLFGRPGDVAAARRAYARLAQELCRASEAAWRRERELYSRPGAREMLGFFGYSRVLPEPVAWKRDFLSGATWAIGYRPIWGGVARADGAGREVARARAAPTEADARSAFSEVREAEPGPAVEDRRAFALGAEAGKKIDVTTGGAT